MAYQTRLLDEYFDRYSAAPTQDTFRELLIDMQQERGLDMGNIQLMAGALSMRMRKAGNSCFQNARQYDAFLAAFARQASRQGLEIQQEAAELDNEVEKGAEGAKRLRPH